MYAVRRCLPLLFLTLAVPASAAEVDKYLLDDTDAALGLNVRQLLDSTLVKKNYLPLAQAALKGQPEIQSQLIGFGIDPLKDIDRILLVHGESCHRTVESKDEVGPFVIVRGRFDPAKFHGKAAQLAQFAPKLLQMHKTPSGGIIYEVTLEKSFFVAMPERTVLVGSLFKDQVSDALDRASGKKKSQLKQYGMRFLIEQADNKNALWLAALGSAALGGETPLPVKKGKTVEKAARQKLSDSGVRELSGGITVADGIKAAFRVKVEDPETAKTLSDALNQFLPQAAGKELEGKLADKKAAPIRELIRSLAVAAEDNDLIIQGSVPGKVILDSLK